MKVECAVVNVITAWSVLMVNKHHWSFSQRATVTLLELQFFFSFYQKNNTNPAEFIMKIKI